MIHTLVCDGAFQMEICMYMKRKDDVHMGKFNLLGGEGFVITTQIDDCTKTERTSCIAVSAQVAIDFLKNVSSCNSWFTRMCLAWDEKIYEVIEDIVEFANESIAHLETSSLKVWLLIK